MLPIRSMEDSSLHPAREKVWITTALLLAAAASAHASRMAGTVHLRRGAVSAFSGRGEDEQVRRGVRTLRLDLGEKVVASPDAEGTFIGHDETQVALVPGATYEVLSDGLWVVEDESRLRVLEFLRPPGRPWRRGSPSLKQKLATVRGDGDPRYRDSRDFEGQPLTDDIALGPNSMIRTGFEGEVLVALVKKGRAVLHPDSRIRLQRKATVLEKGRMHYVAGGPSELVLTPHFSVVAKAGSVLEVEVDPSATRVLLLEGRATVAPPPKARGRRYPLRPGQQFLREGEDLPVLEQHLVGRRLQVGARGVEAALGSDSPREAAESAARASEAPAIPEPPRQEAPPQFAREQSPPFRTASARAAPASAPSRTGDVDEAAMAVARSLEPVALDPFGSEWNARDGRQPRKSRATAPASLPPGLVDDGQRSVTSPQHLLWSSAHAVRTPKL